MKEENSTLRYEQLAWTGSILVVWFLFNVYLLMSPSYRNCDVSQWRNPKRNN